MAQSCGFPADSTSVPKMSGDEVVTDAVGVASCMDATPMELDMYSNALHCLLHIFVSLTFLTNEINMRFF